MRPGIYSCLQLSVFSTPFGVFCFIFPIPSSVVLLTYVFTITLSVIFHHLRVLILILTRTHFLLHVIFHRPSFSFSFFILRVTFRNSRSFSIMSFFFPFFHTVRCSMQLTCSSFIIYFNIIIFITSPFLSFVTSFHFPLSSTVCILLIARIFYSDSVHINFPTFRSSTSFLFTIRPLPTQSMTVNDVGLGLTPVFKSRLLPLCSSKIVSCLLTALLTMYTSLST